MLLHNLHLRNLQVLLQIYLHFFRSGAIQLVSKASFIYSCSKPSSDICGDDKSIFFIFYPSFYFLINNATTNTIAVNAPAESINTSKKLAVLSGIKL